MQRRELAFRSFAEVNDEVQRLLSGGCEPTGNWDLAQVCKHLALAFSGSVMESPRQTPWLVRRIIGPIWRRRVFRAGRLADGIPTPKGAVPKAGGDPQRAATQLARAIERFQTHDGPFSEHPMLGRLDREQWERFHLIHCSHHLSFLRPTVAGSADVQAAE